ncbi:four helix bundle protein [bacterium]|jgi:four helix bundle protein|nr:four helix bundle protein [Crocinitomicaceae bacterium]MBT7431634.1 four helix bundle protein [bacterium]
MNSNFRTLNLAIEFHRECQKLKMKAYLKSQLERATSSVALNLSEGNSRFSTKDRKRFFHISYASLKEAEVALLLASIPSDSLFNLSNHLGGSIYKLIKRCS